MTDYSPENLDAIDHAIDQLAELAQAAEDQARRAWAAVNDAPEELRKDSDGHLTRPAQDALDHMIVIRRSLRDVGRIALMWRADVAKSRANDSTG